MSSNRPDEHPPAIATLIFTPASSLAGFTLVGCGGTAIIASIMLTSTPCLMGPAPSPEGMTKAVTAPASGNKLQIVMRASEDKELKRAPVNPVSYTHLRAHETRHDLVCRLLLEKKKKKK